MGRRAKFALALVLVPLLALLALELRLRTAVERKWELPPGSGSAVFRVLCIGDSITHGGNGSHAYPFQLEKILKERLGTSEVVVWNMGLPGAETTEILAHLPEWLEQFQPHAVVSMMGANDHRVGRLGESEAGNLRIFRLWALAKREFGEKRDSGELEQFLRSGADDLDYHQKVLWHFNRDIFEAIPFHEQMLAAFPNHGFARTSLGKIRIMQERYDEAEPFLLEARRIGKERSQPELEGVAENYLYDLYDRTRRETEIRAMLNSRIQASPGEPWPWEMMVGRLRKSGALKEAEKLAREGMEKSRSKDRLGRLLVRILREQGKAADASAIEAKILPSEESLETYRTLLARAKSSRAKVFFMQYPTLDLGPLHEAVGEETAEYGFVSNLNFAQLIREKSYDWYFTDDHGGAYGHLTSEGAVAMAKNVADVLLADRELASRRIEEKQNAQ